MKTSPAAKRYARALVELAHEQKQTPKIQKDLQELSQAWADSSELRGVFENPSVTLEMRRKVLEALASRMGLAPLTKNTVLLLADNGRFGLIAEITAEFNDAADELSGAVSAEVTTATAMPPAFYTKLQAQLQRVTGQTVTLVKKEDPSIIAGVVTRIGDRVYDGSVKSRLDKLRDQLLA